MKRVLDRQVIASGLIVIIVSWLTGIFWNYTQDDVFITYAYSRNIALGQGFVFNIGEQVQGTTTPLYTLIMALFYRFHTDVLHIGNILSAIFLLIACWCIVQTFPLHALTKFFTVLLVCVSPIVYVSFGMETLLYCAWLLGAFWLWAKGTDNRPDNKSPYRLWAIILAGALTWTRSDGVVLGVVFCLIALWEARNIRPIWKAVPWKLGLVYSAVITPWYLFAWRYFGSPLPNTFGAKQEFLSGIKFWQDGLLWWTGFYGNNPLTLLFIPLVIIGLWQAFKQGKIRPVALWAILYTVGYTALNVTAFWYYTPLVVILIVLTTLGAEWVARRLATRFNHPRAVMIAASAIVLIIALFSVQKAVTFGAPPERVATYTMVGQWLHDHTPAESTVVVADLGIVGYYAERRMIDSFGLIVPQMYYHTPEYAILKYKPDYVVATQYWLFKRFAEADWFKYYYLPVVQISTAHDDFSPMIVYKRRLALETPTEAVQGFDLPLSCSINASAGQPLPKTFSAALDKDTIENGTPDNDTTIERLLLWGQYPGPVVSNEKLVEQTAIPLTVAPGDHSWIIRCAETETSGNINVQSFEQAPDYTNVSGLWDDTIALNGIAAPDGLETWSGGTLRIALRWEARREISKDYSIFLHVLDKAGNLVAQSDGYPQDNKSLTGTWKVGDTVIDVRQVALPAALPQGQYSLLVGWYDWRTQQRLPINGNVALIH